MTPIPSPAPSVPPRNAAGLTPVDILRVALHWRRRLLVAPLLVAATVVAWGMFQPRQWTAHASFTASGGGGGLTRLAGLAAQFGVNVPSADAAHSPDFYADVLRGDGMLRRLLAAKYTDTDGRAVDLAARLVPGESDPARRTEFALRLLRNAVSTGVGLKTGIVRLDVRLDDPELVRQFAAKALDEVNALNVTQQQAQGTQEREFNDQRLAVARRELRVAEDRLEGFLRGNRNIATAPQLLMQEERLRREVTLKQQVVAGLQQGFEQARLEESRDVPVITVIESPARPALPDSRKLVLKALFALLASGAALLGVALLGEWRRRAALASPEVAAELAQLTHDTVRDLRQPWRLVSPRRDRAA